MRFFVAVTTLCFVCSFSAIEVLGQTSDIPMIENPLEQQIRTWIEMLDSPRYRDRATASANLQNLGASAIETLEQVASEGGSEASERAIEILKRHFHGPDGVLKAKASEALERIAAQTDLSKSKVAEKILTPAEDQLQAVPMIPQFFPRFQMPANQRISVRVTINNGDKDIQVEENGKSIRVRENQKDGIQVERKDANGNIEKKSFKDETELKEKDPEAHRAYERGNGGGIKLEFNGGLQAIPNVPGAPGAPNFDEIRKQHEALHQQHLERIRQLREGRGIEQPIKPADPEPAPEPPAETKIIDAIEV